jgi:hypothetical protein
VTPTLSVAGLHDSDTDPSPAVAVNPLGAVGAAVSAAACGVAEAVADGWLSLPDVSYAVTRYVYVVPFVRLLSVQELAVTVAVGVVGQLPSAFCRYTL